MEKHLTECVFCGKVMEWQQELFTEGEHGEPVCEECKEGDA